jgi:hypothetical protein
MLERLIKLHPSQISFENAAVLLNRSKRFVLPIPELPDGGEDLICPDGPQQGTAIYLNEDGSVQKGIVFYNHTDSGWQGVQGNGKEAIIINDLTEEQQNKLLVKINQIAPDIANISPSQIQAVLKYAREELKLGDMFDKGLESISRQMRFVDLSRSSPDLGNARTFLGYMEVSKNDEHRAVRIDRGFYLDGPVRQRYQNGAVVVKSGEYVWGVDKGVIQRNWVLKNGAGNEQPVTSIEDDIPEYTFK